MWTNTHLPESFANFQLHVSDGFGDLALVNDQPRAATIVTLERCELVRIEKTDYNRVLKFIHEKQISEMTNFLRSVPAFEGWTKAALRTIAGKMAFKKYQPGDTIIEEGGYITLIDLSFKF
jgi:CRP-like cAMP-binding protein